MDPRLGKLLFVTVGALLVTLLFSPSLSTCGDVERAEGLDLMVAELQMVKEQSRALAKAVAELQTTLAALPPAPAGARAAPPPPLPAAAVPPAPPAPAARRHAAPAAAAPHVATPAESDGKDLARLLRRIPNPISKDQAKQRVRPTPQCLDAVEWGWLNNSFSSQYSQDWFLFVNYFHHIKKGFYLDIGANEPKDLSNTWFLDVCLGWDGVCVEADPSIGKRLREERSCKVVNTCVDSTHKKVALQAAGLAMGHIVPMDKKNDRGKVMQCTTMADIVRDHNITHVDFMSLDVEDHEPHVLQTWPEERDGFTVDLILIENEKTSKVPGRCHSPHLMRYPFWNRGYGMLGFHGEPQGDDLWVKLDRPHLWRTHLRYARDNTRIERQRLRALQTLLPEAHRTAAVLNKFMKKGV